MMPELVELQNVHRVDLGQVNVHTRTLYAFAPTVKCSHADRRRWGNQLPLAVMEPTRDDIRAWLTSVLTKTGDTPSGLARKAGLATTTLTRLLNDPAAPMLQLRSIAKIAHVAGVQPIGVPSAGQAGVPLRGLSEPEGLPIDAGEHRLAEVLRLLVDGRNAADPWRLQTHALEEAGYLPGDIIIVDLNRMPVAGDVVCAQAYKWSEGKAETVFRLFEPPYLVAASRDLALRRPLLVDNNQVIIKGVVTEMLRVAASPAP